MGLIDLKILLSTHNNGVIFVYQTLIEFQNVGLTKLRNKTTHNAEISLLRKKRRKEISYFQLS